MAKQKGLTLLEIVIATVIFALIMTGLVNLFIAAKRLTLHARSRMQATELGKFFLDPLQRDVRQDTWETVNNCLNSDGSNCDTTAQTLNNIDFTPQYQIDPVNDPAGNPTSLRRVVVTLTWDEPE